MAATRPAIASSHVHGASLRARPASAGIPLSSVTGVILAGGASSRMGCNKALLPSPEGLFIEVLYRRMASLFPHVIVVTNTPEHYASLLPCRLVADTFPGCGPLAGIHAALAHSSTPYIFTAACDMPFVDPEVIRAMAAAGEGDVVIADCGAGWEPLHAFYGATCAEVIERRLIQGRRNIISFFDDVRVCTVPKEVVAEVDPRFRSFCNINTPDEYFSMRLSANS